MIVTGNPVGRATVCILALLLCLTSRASGEYESREMLNGGPGIDSSCMDGKCVKRTASEDVASSMWFGPRLGRRRRSDEKQEVNSEIAELADALDSGRVALFAIPANEKRQPSFTPRLGRASDEDLSYALDRNEIDELSRMIPRLGRQVPMVSPRLGRQLRNLLRKGM